MDDQTVAAVAAGIFALTLVPMAILLIVTIARELLIDD